MVWWLNVSVCSSFHEKASWSMFKSTFLLFSEYKKPIEPKILRAVNNLKKEQINLINKCAPKWGCTILITKWVEQKLLLNPNLRFICVEGLMMENQTVSVHSNDHWDCPVESCYKYIVSCYCKANEFIPNIFAEKLNLTSLSLLTS